jgi:hypothetical protein
VSAVAHTLILSVSKDEFVVLRHAQGEGLGAHVILSSSKDEIVVPVVQFTW